MLLSFFLFLQLANTSYWEVADLAQMSLGSAFVTGPCEPRDVRAMAARVHDWRHSRSFIYCSRTTASSVPPFSLAHAGAFLVF